ncbi:MAG: SGNH/GDSL hydrolase family protein [Pseudomonadota bacterium]
MKDPLSEPRDNPFLDDVRRTRLKAWASWLLLPVCLPQAFWVRRRQSRLMPPAGPLLRTVGSSGAIDQPHRAPLRLLVMGDSTVAGVGTGRLEDALPVQIAQVLSAAVDRPVALHIAGNSSATASDLRDHVLRHLPRDSFDVIVLVIGVNDAKNLHTVKRFSRAFSTLVYGLKARFPSALVAHCPIVPLSVIPLLPQPLKTLLRWRSDVIDARAACLCAAGGVVRFARHMDFPAEGFARDGFHVNETGAKLWAEEVVRELMGMPAFRERLRSG